MKGLRVDPEISHPRFKRRLANSQYAVWLVARWLRRFGNTVDVCPVSVAESYTDRGKHVDKGDIYLTNKAGERMRVEVKHLGASFTDRFWPFKHFMVCNQRSYDRAQEKPAAYFHLSADEQFIAVTLAATRDHWYVQDMHDKLYEQTCPTYFCPINLVKFMEFSA